MSKKVSTKKTISIFLATILLAAIIPSFINMEKAQAQLPDVVTDMLKSNLPKDNINNNNNLFSHKNSDLSNDLEISQGPPGSQGPPFLFDLDSTYVVERTIGPFDNTPGSLEGVDQLILCDIGDKIISGGYSTNEITDYLHTSTDRPFLNEEGFNNEGWLIGFVVTGPVEEVTVYAYCFDNPPDHIP